MERILKGWKQYLKENEEGPRKYKLFCDMDGVLVDFEKGVLEYMNERMRALAAGGEPVSEEEQKDAVRAAEALGGWEVPIAGQHIKRPNEGGIAEVRDLMYTMVENNYEVWANLPWIPGGKELWNHIRQYNPEILTAPMGPESERGKATWCARELGNVNVNITDNKSPYGQGDGKRQGLLIDDREKYRDQFRQGGGKVVAHEPGNAKPSINQLKALGFH